MLTGGYIHFCTVSENSKVMILRINPLAAGSKAFGNYPSKTKTNKDITPVSLSLVPYRADDSPGVLADEVQGILQVLLPLLPLLLPPPVDYGNTKTLHTGKNKNWVAPNYGCSLSPGKAARFSRALHWDKKTI